MKPLLILTVIISLTQNKQILQLVTSSLNSRSATERRVASLSSPEQRRLNEAQAAAIKAALLRLQISKNTQNSLNPKQVDALVNAFLIAESRHNVPARLLSAIAFVESGYDISAINNKTRDYGIMQVNAVNIKAHKLDAVKLTTNLQYSVDRGAAVLVWFLRKYPINDAIKRYNCGVKRDCVKRQSVIEYKERILAAL